MPKSLFVSVVVLVLLSSGIVPGARLDVTQPGDTIQGVPNDNDWPGNEAPPLAIDDDTATKYLHFKGDFDPDPGTGGTGFQVTPSNSQTVVAGLSFTTANDVPGRDPVAYELSGSNVSINGPYELIAAGEIADFQQATDWPRFTMNETSIVSDNDKPYDHYQLLFTAIRGPVGGSVNSVQIAEVELLGVSMVSLDPVPADGSIHPDTWVGLSWTPGGRAASFDVYFGDDYDQVNNGTGETFQGNQAMAYFVVGFPGFSFPEGLVPGTTYYWRIDDVEADKVTKHKGTVWSFLVPPKSAYNPIPADNASFVTVDGTLSWTGGYDAILHTVYFGDNYDDVENATGGLPMGIIATYNPGTLESGTTYFWRVDEFDGVATYKGDVWSFTTAKAGGGVRGDYYTGMNFESFALNRIDPQIDFDWAGGEPDPAVGADQFSVRWTGSVEAAYTETYTFYARADDGVRLWVGGQQLVDAWVDQSATEYEGTIDLVAGNMYTVVMEMYENGGDAVAELRWSSPSTPKQIVPQAALSPPIKAGNPSPPNRATGVKMTPVLRWKAGDYAASHEVYFGTDADAVANATKASPEFKTIKALGDENYDPGPLAWNTTYYWRVDEVNDLHHDSPWTGNLWSFSTGDFIVVDDFEGYTDDDPAGEAIWQHWIDGYGVADNGSQVGYLLPPYAEQTIIHSGLQSMPLLYDNTNGVRNSEVELTLTTPRDWTKEGVAEFSLWFRGYPGSVGSFVEGPTGIYSMTASGTDIWDNADEFHYVYKTLSGAGSIIAKVEHVQNTNGWAKAGVMIRETLDPGSKHAFACITPSNGVAAQGRDTTDGASFNTNQSGITAPYWVKLERSASGNFVVSHSPDGTTWSPVTDASPHSITMAGTVYIGLALTSHDAALTCGAVFSNVTTTGSVSGQWVNQDIGITSNAAEPFYVAASNANGAPAVITHHNPTAATIDVWTQWIIPLQAFSAQGVNLSNVDKIAIGLGAMGDAKAAGGSGTIFLDDIRLYRFGEAVAP